MSHSCCNWKEIYSCFTMFTLSNSEKPSWADLVEEGESGTAIKQSQQNQFISFLPQSKTTMLLSLPQGAKKIIFTACHSGKLKLTFASPDVISTSPKSFLRSRIDLTVLLLFEFLKKDHLPVGQVQNRFHQPDSKIHQPRAIGHYFLCTLYLLLVFVSVSLSILYACYNGFTQMALLPQRRHKGCNNDNQFGLIECFMSLSD